jgi:hypothetical protein
VRAGWPWTGGCAAAAAGSSLPQLLAAARGVRNTSGLPQLTDGQVLAWARAHKRRTGAWPSYDSGPVEDAGGETWGGINMALYKGRRGLPGGSSLAKLLGVRKPGK